MSKRINEKILRAVALALCLSLGTIPLVGAAERLEAPRALPDASGFFALPPSGGAPGLPGIDLMGLKTGKPATIAAMSSWVNSDLMPDDYTTDVRWFTNETLVFFVWFYTEKARDVTVDVIVKDVNRARVFSDTFTDAPLVGELNGFFFNSQLFWDPGFYKLTVKFKQGKKVAGLKYWFQVVTADTAAF
jgi:hypothetical protein